MNMRAQPAEAAARQAKRPAYGMGSSQERFYYKTHGKPLMKEPVQREPDFDHVEHLWLSCWLSHR